MVRESIAVKYLDLAKGQTLGWYRFAVTAGLELASTAGSDNSASDSNFAQVGPFYIGRYRPRCQIGI
jgi:hypothetical protein